MACTDRGRACLVHLAFYTLQGFLIAIAYVAIFGTAYEPDDSNIIGDNPGLSYRPHPPDGDLKSIISYKIPHRNSYKPWVDSLEKFLEVYRKPGLGPGRGYNIVNCDFWNPPARGQVCDVDVKNYGPCIAENYFSYHKGTPCVYLRLNLPIGWKPVYHNDTKHLPDDMPSYLKNHIHQIEQFYPSRLNTVWLSCDGETSADKEMIGPLKFFPTLGFPGYYTLNTDVEGYLAPLVAVQFERPTNGLLINIKCKLWARNIKHDDYSAMGGVEFGLLLE